VKKIAFILIPVTMLLAGCPTPKVLPDIPKVEFRSFVLGEEPNDLGQIVLIGVLNFYFEDGDGDIGFEASFDSLQPDSLKYNLFLMEYERVDGKYRMIDTSDLDVKQFYRIPPLDREGQNKTLKGEIEVKIDYYFPDKSDTLKYTFYLMDRAYNRSNTDTTTEIIFDSWLD
jgi:hypothetical protein